MDEAEFHKRASSHINVDLPALRRNLDEFLAITSYVAGQYDVDEDFQKLTKQMEAIEKDYKGKERNRVFYMALPPSVFTQVAEKIKKNCYTDQGVNRIIVEKPFGKDLESSQEMMGKLKALWTEDEVRWMNRLFLKGSLTSSQTFRIDHYLGKEMVKNLLVLRFGNVILDASFNKDLISNVQITFKEPFGTEGRGGYFDEFGIIRDVMQNRMFSDILHEHLREET